MFPYYFKPAFLMATFYHDLSYVALLKEKKWFKFLFGSKL